MHKSASTYSANRETLPRLISTKKFPEDFESLLGWDNEVPNIVVPYEIESTLQPDGHHSVAEVKTLAEIAQHGIGNFFNSYDPRFKSYLSSTISNATKNSKTALRRAIREKNAVIRIRGKILRSKVWRAIPSYYNVSAFTLSPDERTEDFAHDVFTENEKTIHGRGRHTYEQFLLAITSAHLGEVLSAALLNLDQIYNAAELKIAAAQIAENTATTIQSANTIKAPASSRFTLSTATGSIAIHASDIARLEASLQTGIRQLSLLGEAALSRAFAVGIGALIYSPSLGNGELYPETVLTLPAETLGYRQPSNLEEIAAEESAVDLEYRIVEGSRKYSVVRSTREGNLSSKVPVRALHYNATTKSYFSTATDLPPIALFFPSHASGKKSTSLPAEPVERPTYSGLTLSPIIVTPESLPVAESVDFRDCIYCFPAETGLPPIYVVFNRPYGATTPGVHSGRWYDPEKAGGPTVSLDWRDASITQEGIDLVRLHTKRFGRSDANSIMIDRLERIFRGELSADTVDKKFYTHELRELERYRALGIHDKANTQDGGATWNNAHTATLEDFGLVDSIDQFYTEEALNAAQQQPYE